VLISSSGDSKIPDEIIGPGRPIHVGPGDIPRMSFLRGQYKFKMRVKFQTPPGQNPDMAQTIDNQLYRLEGKDPETGRHLDDELKRIYIYKLDLLPPDEQGMQRLTVVLRIIDNPIWFPALLLGIGAIAGGYFTYSTVDTAESFTDELGDAAKNVAIAAGVVTLLFFLTSK